MFIEKNHIVYTYEYHELRANQAKEEFERHGIDLKEDDKERIGGIHTEVSQSCEKD